MGIQGLSKLIEEHAPSAVKESEIKSYFARKVAVDASMSLYQFLIAVRSDGAQLTNDTGETTSHLMGTFYRTIRMIEHGIKPVYVFDGKPPNLKSHELSKRTERREEAAKQLAVAEEAGDTEGADKFSRRLVRVTKEHVEECKTLLKLMGVPFVEAPCEAEAQCAALVKAGKVYATATEDMDALTFGSDVLLRHLTFSEARKMPIKEYNLGRVLDGLGLSQSEFTDLCILLGCDYCESIKGTRLQSDTTRAITRGARWVFRMGRWMIKKEARELFKKPEIMDPDQIELVWSDPDEEGIVNFMVNQKGFNEQRIRSAIKNLIGYRKSATQTRLDNFFSVSVPSAVPKKEGNSSGPNSKKVKVTPAAKKAKLTSGRKAK